MKLVKLTEIKFRLPFSKLRGVASGHEGWLILSYRAVTIGRWYVRLSWEPVEHKTTALSYTITEEAFNDLVASIGVRNETL